MKLEELLKSIINDNEINLDDFCKWFNHWVTDLYFCSSEEEIHRIQKMALKDINTTKKYTAIFTKFSLDKRSKSELTILITGL